MAIVIPPEGLEAVLNIILNPLADAKVHLLQEGGDEWDTAIEASFTGYAAVAVAELASAYDEDEEHATRSLLEVTFTQTSPGSPMEVHAWCITVMDPVTDERKILCSEQFAPFLTFENEDDSVTFDITLFDRQAVE